MIPSATYRIQLNPAFRFIDGCDLVPYLSELGITDLYSSPQYKPRRGSSHGYDIANPLRMNPELGTEDDFDEMAEKLRKYGMGLLLDTVPNHMAASYENPWWRDVLENGQASAYAGYFDIEWRPATAKADWLQRNRVLLPILGDLYGQVLARRELTLKIEDTGMDVRYHEHRLPLDPKSYLAILRRAEGIPNLEEIARDLEQLPDRDETGTERVMQRRREKERAKERLWLAYQSSAEVKRAIDEALLAIAESPDELDALLGRQAYRLAYWKIGYEEINYRRFFDINGLVGLRVEVPEVFDNRHQITLALVRGGKITGLRIDHIDGLWDPECYLRRMQSQCAPMVGQASRQNGQREAHQPPFYIVVEKILGRGERLPDWPVSGTTGYDFLNALNSIFIEPRGLAKLEESYARRAGNFLPFAEICYRSSKLVMERLFTGDVNALAHHLGLLAASHREARDVRISELTAALVEVTACLPVYRTYIRGFEIAPEDRSCIERTLALARRRTAPAEISGAAFDFLRQVLLLELPRYLEARRQEWLEFVMRWQQFSGPVMAKGLEDTASYRYNALLSMNEVGGDPLRERPPMDLEEFHEFNRRRLAQWPDTMNATATHDSKRGEDTRARLNVLSELPEEWSQRLARWTTYNESKKETVNGALAPSVAEEIMIYQTLLGVWPCEMERLREFLVKALREAKVNSSWMEPQEPYEQAVLEFTERILARDSPFLQDFLEFQAMVALPGARNSLSQLVLKIAAPGVPDFYQGTELWQFSLVDPDNRRPVDYKRRGEMLEMLRRREAEDRIGLIRELAANPLRDETKLFVTYKALEFRKANRDLFARGEYLPLRAEGPGAVHVCAFARRLSGRWAAVVAPRWTARLTGWGGTSLALPGREWQDVLTGLIPASARVGDLLAEFPVALLKS